MLTNNVRQRFYAMTKKKGDCLVWTGYKNAQGYGKFGITQHKSFRAHRFAYEMEKGSIPTGMIVCHTCDNPSCVNVDHLFVGTHAENTKDMLAKGRNKCGRGAKHGMAKLSELQVNAIRNATGTQRAIANHFGVSQAQVSRIKAAKSRMSG